MSVSDVFLGPLLPKNTVALTEFVQRIRHFMRDFPELNRLIKGEEHSDRFIIYAIQEALEDFNTTVPVTSYTLDNFPSPYILRQGAVVILLESSVVLQTRNHISFSDGGIQVAADKVPLYQSLIQLFSSKYERMKQNYKIYLNIEGGWGSGPYSEYRWVNGFYGGL